MLFLSLSQGPSLPLPAQAALRTHLLKDFQAVTLPLSPRAQLPFLPEASPGLGDPSLGKQCPREEVGGGSQRLSSVLVAHDRPHCWPAEGPQVCPRSITMCCLGGSWGRAATGTSSSEMNFLPMRLAHIFSDGDTCPRMVLCQVIGTQRPVSSSVLSGAVLWAPILSPS